MDNQNRIKSIKKIDHLLEQHKVQILNNLAKHCIDTNDGTYYLGCFTTDLLKMLYSIISRNMSSQEARAAYKIALDTVLIPNGMSVQIHEFN